MNEPKQTIDTHAPEAESPLLPRSRPERPNYEDLVHPLPLDKKWRDDFRAGRFLMDVFTQTVADYED